MKTIEELNGMTQDELIRVVEELQSKIEEERKETDKFKRWYEQEYEKRINTLNTFRNMLDLIS